MKIIDTRNTMERIQASKYFSFSEALYELKAGKCLGRERWDNVYKFIFMQVPSKINREVIPNMQSLPDTAKNLLKSKTYGINYKHQIAMCNDSKGTITGYVPVMDDIFAEDWFIVE